MASFRCTYARAWIQVKWYHDLSVDGAERSALTGMLDQDGSGGQARVFATW